MGLMLTSFALSSLAVVATQTSAAPAKAPHDPRTQPTTAADALWTLDDVAGRMIAVGDCNGDGKGDVFVERGPRDSPDRIDAISSRDGRVIRTACAFDTTNHPDANWDAGDDVNGDGVPDLLLGFPNDSSVAKSAGLVRVVSGKDGAKLFELRGSAANEEFGRSVAFVGDIDGDHRADFAIGAPQFRREHSVAWPKTQGSGSAWDDDGERNDFWILADGTKVRDREKWQRTLSLGATLAGYVSIRSGRDGAEIRRISGNLAGHGFGMKLAAVRRPLACNACDLLVQCDVRSDEPVRIFKSSTGELASKVEKRVGWFGCAGDLDGNGSLELFLDRVEFQGYVDRMQVDVLKSGSRSVAFTLPCRGWGSEFGVTVPVGDIDGDGCDDIAIGDGHFHLKKKSGDSPARDIRAMSLAALLEIENEAGDTGHMSGCAVVYSGRTHAPIFGAWGEPNTFNALGRAIAAPPDISGDGFPDLAISDATTLYAFAGPGAEHK